MLSTLLNVTGLLIGLTAQEHISSASPIIVLRSRVLCIAIPNAREDESFADDLNKKRGIVNSRVALLLRSIEVHPFAAKMCCSSRTHPSPFPISLTLPHTRVFSPWPKKQNNQTPDHCLRTRRKIEMWRAVLTRTHAIQRNSVAHHRGRAFLRVRGKGTPARVEAGDVTVSAR